MKEVASFEYSRIHGVGKLNAFSDDLRVLYTILSERYRFREQAEPATRPLAVIR